MDYPSREAETEILARYGGVLTAAHQALESVRVIERALLGAARAEAEQVHVAEALSSYVLDLARATREHPRVALGLSTRGSLALLKAARVNCGLRGADFVTPDDVKHVAGWILAHRLVLTPEAALEGTKDAEVVASLLTSIQVPR
jgi:MoxR-like ATPase